MTRYLGQPYGPESAGYFHLVLCSLAVEIQNSELGIQRTRKCRTRVGPVQMDEGPAARMARRREAMWRCSGHLSFASEGPVIAMATAPRFLAMVTVSASTATSSKRLMAKWLRICRAGRGLFRKCTAAGIRHHAGKRNILPVSKGETDHVRCPSAPADVRQSLVLANVADTELAG